MGGSWEDHGRVLGGYWEDPGRVLGGSWETPGRLLRVVGVQELSWEGPGGSCECPAKYWEGSGR